MQLSSIETTIISRTLASALRRTARKFPVVVLRGQRQSGKTTLARAIGQAVWKTLALPKWELMEILVAGFYSRIHDRNLSPYEWLAGYCQT